MARKKDCSHNKINRKRFYNASRSKFKRLLAIEKRSINDKIYRTSFPVLTTNENETNTIDETAEEKDQYLNKLRDWALKYNIRIYCMRDLLKLLREIGVPFLPKDPRTFLQIPRKVVIEEIANGGFWYHGIEKNLRRILQAANVNMNLSLNFHFDGLQLFKSSSKQFWPILGQIHGECFSSNDLENGMKILTTK